MKATGIVRRVDDLGRIVIPKEIRRTLRIREGDPLLTTLTVNERYLWAMEMLQMRIRQHYLHINQHLFFDPNSKNLNISRLQSNSFPFRN